MRNSPARKPAVLFLSFVGPHYSRSSTLLNSHSDSLQKKYMELPQGVLSSVSEVFRKRRQIRKSDFLVVMSPCHVLTPILKIVVRKTVILDAGWSLTDGVTSRGLRKQQILKLPIVALIDFFSLHFADLVLLESHSQVARTSKHFLVRKSKLRVQFTGLNEASFTAESSQSKVISDVSQRISELNNPLVVLFRGKINRESGFGNILRAANMLDGAVTFIFALGENANHQTFPRNVIPVPYISESDIMKIYSLSHVSIGQVSSHPRLRYTIPHKAFEAGYFSMPYITADSVGVREYLSPSSAIFLKNPSAHAVAKAILELRHESIRNKYSNEINLNYRMIASQEILSERFEQFLLEIWNVKKNRSH